MSFKFNFFTLFILTFFSFALATSSVQAKDYSLGTPSYESANSPISTQLFNFEEENNNGSPSPSQNSGEQEASGTQSMIKGSLLGKLLFNMPFEKTSFVDILTLLAVAFMISKLISRANNKKPQGSPNDNAAHPHSSSGPAAPPPGFDPWSKLRSGKSTPKKGKTIPFPGTTEQTTDNTRSENFHASSQPEPIQEDDSFLKGAKMLYIRMHEAWKNQNLEFIQHFSSPQVFNLFQTRSQNPDKEEFIDIVKIDAQVIKDEIRNGEPYKVVEFTALAHKSKQAGPPSETKETWAFLEPAHTGTWRLEEIL